MSGRICRKQLPPNKGGLAVNGMSYQKRDGINANSAVIVSVTPDDFPGGGCNPLGGILFQRELEKRAYELGNGRIVQQLYGDYKNGRISKAYGDFLHRPKAPVPLQTLAFCCRMI